MSIGVVAGLAGVVAGIVKIAYRVEADCPDGKMWPNDATDFTCYAHPQLASGVAIVAGSIMGAILVVLVAYVAHEIAVARTNDPAESDNSA